MIICHRGIKLYGDEYIESLVDMSYNEVDGLSKVRMFPPKK